MIEYLQKRNENRDNTKQGVKTSNLRTLFLFVLKIDGKFPFKFKKIKFFSKINGVSPLALQIYPQNKKTSSNHPVNWKNWMLFHGLK